jgi:hypothetical protein
VQACPPQVVGGRARSSRKAIHAMRSSAENGRAPVLRSPCHDPARETSTAAAVLRLCLGGGAAEQRPGPPGHVGFRHVVRRRPGQPAAYRPFGRDYGRGHGRWLPSWRRGPACDRRRRGGRGLPRRLEPGCRRQKIHLFTGGSDSAASSEMVELNAQPGDCSHVHIGVSTRLSSEPADRI